MDEKEMMAIIEALLFTWGDPLNIKDIASVLDIETGQARKLIEALISDYDYNRRGLTIRRIKNNYQIGTRPDYYPWIEKLNKPKKAKALSNAAIETLSIIAYRQPVIKSEIEAIRGVKCDTAVYTLLDKELIEEKGRLDKIGRPILYGTTDNFLKVFGLESLKDLPELKDSVDLGLENFEEKEEGKD